MSADALRARLVAMYERLCAETGQTVNPTQLSQVRYPCPLSRRHPFLLLSALSPFLPRLFRFPLYRSFR